MNSDVLISLLKGAHLNMEERMKQGLWPHPPLKYAEVRKHLAAAIQKQEWFPSDLSSPREGVIIQNNNGEFTCHCLAYGPSGDRRPQLDEQHKFKNSIDAADYYLRNDARLPGDLDGWVVE